MTFTEDNGLPFLSKKDITDVTEDLILYTEFVLKELDYPYVIYEICYDTYELILQLGWMGEH
ncbi:hypothetical protein BFL38_05610 [Brachyspira hampsonii]|uniref:Uncharacterized protein n=1 Tax=Brachyspira hampsonii TaxID=1287055 RepID=A0A1E5NDR5_9SPIR|nr:hypothetical protein [Brachyspira hampsonii]OEJ14247.1 hypothetical protein BFL38_05610 [Brachyspira hampsonii]